MNAFSKWALVLAAALLCSYVAGRYLSEPNAKYLYGASFGLAGAGGTLWTTGFMKHWLARAVLVLVGVILVILARSIGEAAGR